MKKVNTLALSSIFIGLLIIAFSVWLWQEKEEQYAEFDSKARGNVIRYQAVGDKRYPVLRFIAGSNTITFIDSTTSIIDRSKDSTDILFNSKNPENATMYDSYDTWGMALSVGIVGFFIAFFGYIINRLGKKEYGVKNS
jgi:nitrogen fixation-related uncharacterized protein